MDREARAEIICNLAGKDPNNEADWAEALAEADQQIADGFEYAAETYPAAYHWLGWESEADFEPGRPDTYFLTICHPDGEEYAVIIHRTVDGQFPLDGEVAKGKEADAQRIVDALNATL